MYFSWFGMVPKILERRLEVPEIKGRIEIIQTTALLRSTRILRWVLETRRYLLSHSDSSERPSANTGVKYLQGVKIRKEYLGRTIKLLETKLCNRNLLKEINICAVPLVRYSGPFLKWTREELRQIDQMARKLIPTHKALHLKDVIDYMNQEKKEEEGLQRLETV